MRLHGALIVIMALVLSAFPDSVCHGKEPLLTLSQAIKAAFRLNPSIEGSRHRVAAKD